MLTSTSKESLITLETLTILLLGFLAGAVLRTLAAYLQKYVETPDLKFDGRYLATMTVSMVASFMFAALAFSNTQINQILQLTTDPLYLAIFTAAIGYTANDLTNRTLNLSIKQKQQTTG
jgi:hypothetical protein